VSVLSGEVHSPRTEIPALRALLRTYLDLLAFPQIKLKLFVRNDLFRKIIEGGFVNLTHINARKIDIIWDQDDLFNLLYQRFLRSADFLTSLNLVEKPATTIFNSIFPTQVDVGSKKPATWQWILSRIRDGNNVAPPRNLIDLVNKAQQAQLRREEREPRTYSPDTPIIQADSLKRALAALSQARVEDTLLAEAGDLAPHIERFRDSKAEQNEESLSVMLQKSGDDLKQILKVLCQIGFLEETTDTYKVPMLYRDGLNITQGKAFVPVSENSIEADVDI
jgi:hypothetical protein